MCSSPPSQQECANKFIAGNGIANCGNDIKCICSNQSFISGVACCLANQGAGGCSPADQSSAVAYASQICRIGGVTTIPSAVVCTSTGTSTSAPTGATSPTRNLAPRETGGAAANVLGGLVALGAALL